MYINSNVMLPPMFFVLILPIAIDQTYSSFSSLINLIKLLQLIKLILIVIKYIKSIQNEGLFVELLR